MLKQPESMDELVYFTRRDIGNGEVTVWVFKGICPKCSKGQMGKPLGPDGKVKVRAKEYVCTECGYEVEKGEYEETLEANAAYTCPECGHKGQGQVPFRRKNIGGAKALRIKCEKCSSNIDVTQKMKEPKKK